MMNLILLSNLLTCFALYLMRALGNPLSSIVALGVGNLFLFSWFYVREGKRIFFILNERNGKLIFIWASAYSLTYALFILFPELITLSTLVCAKAISPFIVIGLREGIRKSAFSMFDFMSVLLLTSIVGINFYNNPFFSLESISIFICFLVLFTSSQMASNILGKSFSSLDVIKPLSAFNGIGLLVLSVFAKGEFSSSNGDVLLMYAITFSLLIVSIQGTMLKGFAQTSVKNAMIFLVSNVPISIIFDFIFFERSGYLFGTFFISILFMVNIVISKGYKPSSIEVVK